MVPASVDLQRLRSEASAFSDARLIVLFGSVARGTPAPWSDVDIGVAGVPFWRALEIGVRLGATVDRDVHTVDLDAASDWLRFEVAREGALLFEGAPQAWARFQAEAVLRWFDLEPIVTLCARGARRRLLQESASG